MKKQLTKALILTQAILSMVFFASTAVYADSSVDLSGLKMKNAAQPYENIVTGGQPSAADLSLLKAQGVTNIINLRGAGESVNYNEAEEAKKLGINYVSLQIASADAVSIENAKKLDELLKANSGKTLVHCASSNRVGALFAIKAAVIDGKSHDQAMTEGLSAGMKSLRKRTEVVLSTLKK